MSYSKLHLTILIFKNIISNLTENCRDISVSKRIAYGLEDQGMGIAFSAGGI